MTSMLLNHNNRITHIYPKETVYSYAEFSLYFLQLGKYFFLTRQFYTANSPTDNRESGKLPHKIAEHSKKSRIFAA